LSGIDCQIVNATARVLAVEVLMAIMS
jgi:hypothetical protein